MYPLLFQPIRVGNCTLNNRFAVTAMVSNFCNEDGTCTDQFIRYHEAKAKGGWGLIITEDFRIGPNMAAYPNTPGLWNDAQIEGFQKLTDAVHRYESKIFAQIYHCGRKMTRRSADNCDPLVAPSALTSPVGNELPHELTKTEIHDLVRRFGESAGRAKRAGFDGVEIHAGHGYLICEFFSSYSNKRTDEYGGSFYNRMRFFREIYAAMRENVGPDFPITARISADEMVPGGNTILEAKALAREFERMGGAGINISATFDSTSARTVAPPMSVPHGWIAPLAAEVKRAVAIPVLTVGRINDPLLAESILAAGEADIVAMSRASLADPELPNKVKSGRIDEIRQCIGCLQGCQYEGNRLGKMGCLVNPEIGREYLLDWTPAKESKKVFVAGGGVAGMEAAIAAARKGHRVTLYENSDTLGGQFVSAAYPIYKGEFTAFTSWLRSELARHPIDVCLGVELTPELVQQEAPDAVIVATGALPLVPVSISGTYGDNVCSAEEALRGRVRCGKKVVILGGGFIGAETATMFAYQNKEVTIVELRSGIGLDMPVKPLRKEILSFLAQHHVDCRVNTRVESIDDTGVKVSTKDGVETIPADTVILALGYRSNGKLAEELSTVGVKVVVVGDALERRNALTAAREGLLAGVTI